MDRLQMLPDLRPQFQVEAERFAATEAPRWGKSILRLTGWKIRISREQREGWTGKLPFYFFWCGKCECFTKDYPHGFARQQYLNCANCGAYHTFRTWWELVRRPFEVFVVLLVLVLGVLAILILKGMSRPGRDTAKTDQ